MVASAIPPSFHQRSVSLGSRSGSVPRSASVSSGSRGQSVTTFVDASEVTGPSKLSKENKDLLLQYLGIDTELPSLGPPGLRSAYQKYKAITNATPQVMALGNDAEWKAQFEGSPAWIPNIVHFINIFIAKSQFYQIWKPSFSRVQKYQDMRDWLDQHPSRLPTEDLWEIKTSRALGFPDLKKWLNKKDRDGEMNNDDLKGKGKAPESPKRKRKAQESPKGKKKAPAKKNHDRDQPVVQRKHKKSRQETDEDEGEASE